MEGKKISVGTALMLVLLAAVATFNITFFVAAEHYNSRLGNLEALESRYKKLKEISDVVEKNFVGEYTEEEAMEGAAAGFVDGLGDRWSLYMSAGETAEYLAEDENTYVGIGVTVSADNGRFAVTSVTKGGPAYEAGILPLDVFASVDGVPATEFDGFDALVGAIRGEEGTSVTVEMERQGELLSFTMTRAAIFNQGIEAKLLDGGIGYMRISGFDRNVDVEFAEKLGELLDEGARGMVFDVRFNPGGDLHVLVNMLDLLLPEGRIISTKDKEGHTAEYNSDADCIELPMMVLTNNYSVSAAEFFAASLQEYGVAEIVGDRTMGKGYAQRTVMLSDGSSVHLSVISYYTPKGVNLAGVGTTPDHEISLSDEDMYNFYSLTPEQDAQLAKACEVLAAKLPPEPAAEEPEETPELAPEEAEEPQEE